MGGFIAPSNVIAGSVLAPTPALSNSASSGLFQLTNGVGMSISAKQYFALNAVNLALGYIPPIAFAVTGVAGSPFTSSNIALNVVVTNDGTGVIISNNTGRGLHAYSRNVVTGVLTQIGGSPFDAPNALGNGLTVNPAGTVVVTWDATVFGSMRSYLRNTATGVLTLVGVYATGASTGAGALVFSPDGNFVIGTGNGTCAMSVSAVGVLAVVAGSPFAGSGGTGSVGIAVSPNGKFLYVEGPDRVIAYTRNLLTGVLTTVQTIILAAFNNGGCVVTPDNLQLLCTNYVNNAASSISVYNINQVSGLLTLSAAPYVTGNGAMSIDTSPAGDYVYIGNTSGGSGGLNIMTRNTTTGALAILAGSPFAAGAVTRGVAVTPDGSNVLAIDGSALANNIYVYQFGTTSPKPLETLTFDPLGGSGGGVSINGSLSVSGGVTFNGATPATFPAQAGNAGKFLRTDGATPNWSAPAISTPVAMVANAANLVLSEAAVNYIDVTGVLTANGQITTTFPVNTTQVIFDNACTGAFLLQVNAGAYTLPLGKSAWVWNGALFEPLVVAPASGISPIISAIATDIFGQIGATISIDNSTPVTTTSFTACASAQVGSVKRVIPVQDWSVTASANLIVSGVTAAQTFVIKAGTELEVVPLTTTKFRINVIDAHQSWSAPAGRALGTTYTNTTPLPIDVSITCSASGAAGTPYITLDGSTTLFGTSIITSGYYTTIQAVVPPGSTYVANATSLTLVSWNERS